MIHIICQFKMKENARELLAVGYAVDRDETAVDEIWVKMKNDTRSSFISPVLQLLCFGCHCVDRTSLIKLGHF